MKEHTPRTVTSHHHGPQPDTAQQPDPRPGHYYVTARDGERYWLLTGPYASHRAALDDVVRVTYIALDAPGGHTLAFASFGTARVSPDLIGTPQRGRLNELAGVVPQP